MEEEKKYQELKTILEGLQKTLELYNSLNPQEKLTLTPQEEKVDVSNVFVGVHDGVVGLFKTIKYHFQINRHYSFEYNAGTIYVGIDSDYIAIKSTHCAEYPENKWKEIGTEIQPNGYSRWFVANCRLDVLRSFDDIRLMMYNAGQIEPYEIGKASSKEMLEVLKFASTYYQLDHGMNHIR